MQMCAKACLGELGLGLKSLTDVLKNCVQFLEQFQQVRLQHFKLPAENDPEYARDVGNINQHM